MVLAAGPTMSVEEVVVDCTANLAKRDGAGTADWRCHAGSRPCRWVCRGKERQRIAEGGRSDVKPKGLKGKGSSSSISRSRRGYEKGY